MQINSKASICRFIDVLVSLTAVRGRFQSFYVESLFSAFIFFFFFGRLVFLLDLYSNNKTAVRCNQAPAPNMQFGVHSGSKCSAASPHEHRRRLTRPLWASRLTGRCVGGGLTAKTLNAFMLHS